MLDAWARDQRIQLARGTANACADVDPTWPQSFFSLAAYADLVSLERRRHQFGFDPRLYPVIVDQVVLAWNFRWRSDDEGLRFVGDSPDCSGRRHMELISATAFRADLGLTDGSALALQFLMS